MDGGATATEHLLGMIDDSGSTRVAGPPSRLSGSRCGVDRAAQPEEDPAGLRDEGLAACAGGGWPFGAHQPKHSRQMASTLLVLAAVGEVLMATARTPPETSERDIRSQSLTPRQAECPAPTRGRT